MAVTSRPTAKKTTINFGNFGGRGGSNAAQPTNRFASIGQTASNNIKQIDVVQVFINNKTGFNYDTYKKLIYKLSKTKDLEIIKNIPSEYPSLISGKDTISLGIEKAEGSKEDTLKQIRYLEGFLKSVDKKLSNKSFVDNAPKNVVEMEKKKRDDAIVKLENLKKSV